MENLYEKDLYVNKDIECIIDIPIIEYDIKQAGYNLTKYYKLLPEDKIKELSSLSKENKRIKLGIFQRNNDVFKESLKKAFVNIRKEFFEANNIYPEEVISIKKDALFITRQLQNTEFGNVEFVKKNKYTSYYNLNKLELYYNSKTKKLDAKGISDDLLDTHKGYLMEFLADIFDMNEKDPSMETSAKFLVEFANEYKNRELPIEFYREFNRTCKYKTNITLMNMNVHLDRLTEESDFINNLDISYNYKNIIMPLIRLTF